MRTPNRYRTDPKGDEKPDQDLPGLWFFTHGEFEYGPLTDEQVCEAAATGLLLPTDMVRRTDIDEPFTASSVEGLFEEEVPCERAVTAPPPPLAPEPERSRARTSYRPPSESSGAVVCPYCWHRFNPEDFLFIASHENLRGDDVLGPDEMQRFLPSSFTTDGHAKDSEDRICPDRACPYCHLKIPRSLVAMKPLFISIVGASGSGKSYLLGCMCWKLRTTLLERFNIRFTDADAVVNMWLNSYEKILFVQANASKFQHIDKTQIVSDDRHYKAVTLDGMTVLLALPSMFNLQADEDSLFHENANEPINRTLVVYDNAGEHFLPNSDSAASPGTKHLMHSEAVLFLFDPTMDVNFRNALVGAGDIQLELDRKVDRQDIYFTETINRIRRSLGIDPTERYGKPVLVLLSKADVLGAEIGAFLNRDPWKWDPEIESYALDLTCLLQASFAVRSLLRTHAPEAVSAVESFARDVLYLPVSALGHSPTLDEQSGELVVRPCDVAPKWVEAPFLYVLYKLGYVSGLTQSDETHPVPETYQIRGGAFHFVVPGTQERVKLPLCYAGVSLRCPKTGTWFRVPDKVE